MSAPRHLALALLLVGSACGEAAGVCGGGLLEIELRMSPEQVGDLNASVGSGARIPGRARFGAGSELVPMDIEPAGAATLRNFKRNFNLRLGEGVEYRGIRSYRLAATTYDESMLRTPLAYGVFARMGMAVPETTPVTLSVNGRCWGLYHLVEKVDEGFFERRGLPMAVLYSAKGNSNFSPEMSARLSTYFEIKEGPETFVEIERLAALVEAAPQEELEREIFSYLDRTDTVRYLASAIVADHWDGFNKNLFLYSPRLGAPLRLVPWDLDQTWWGTVGQSGRLWLDNLLFERLFAIPGVRQEALDLVDRALAGTESPEAFTARLAALQEEIAEAYAKDDALGGLRGLVLEEKAALLLQEQARWSERVADPASREASGFLGTR